MLVARKSFWEKEKKKTEKKDQITANALTCTLCKKVMLYISAKQGDVNATITQCVNNGEAFSSRNTQENNFLSPNGSRTHDLPDTGWTL